MGKALSTSNTIKAIGVFFAGAIACMLSTWWIWAYTLWAIIVFWLFLYILYRIKVVDVYIQHCAIENAKRDGDFDLVVRGDIKARHNDSIQEARLSLLGWSFPPVDIAIREIDDTFKAFAFRYKLARCFLKDGRDLQNCEKPLDIGRLCIETTQKRLWATEAFNFSLDPPNYYKLLQAYREENWLMKVKNKLTGNTKKVKGYEISKEEFHQILDRASKPIKTKPDKEKT
jgi:hypothetical protein